VSLETLHAQFQPLTVGLQLIILSHHLRTVQVTLVQVASLLGHDSFELGTSRSLHLDVFLCNLSLSLPVGHLSSQCSLILLKLCEVPLHVLACHLEII
jgi:hypothetical protein